MRKLFVDTGHSKKFPGAVGVKKEVDWVRSIADALYPLIDSKKWTIVKVPDVFSTDIVPSSNLNLIQRIKFINKNSVDADWLLSIHGNAATNLKAHGIDTVYYRGSKFMEQKARTTSTLVASSSHTQLFGGGSMPDNAGRFGKVGMVYDTKPLALLVECGFVTNAEDMAKAPLSYAIGLAAAFNSF